MDRRDLLTKAPLAAGAVLLGGAAVVAEPEPDEAEAQTFVVEERRRIWTVRNRTRQVRLRVQLLHDPYDRRALRCRTRWSGWAWNPLDAGWALTSFSLNIRMELLRNELVTRWSTRRRSGYPTYVLNTRWRDDNPGTQSWRARCESIDFGIGGNWYHRSPVETYAVLT